AVCLTGPGTSFMPRPEGRSGCDSTPTTSWPASSRARKAQPANSGVPANTIRIRSILFQARLSRHLHTGCLALGLALLLAQPGTDAILLEHRKVFDEDLAQQVIQFVLNADGQQALGVEFVGLALFVQG